MDSRSRANPVVVGALTAVVVGALIAGVLALGSGSVALETTAARPPAASRPSDARVQTRPNIVLIMVDDMRNDDLRFMPDTQRLVQQRGVRFVNSFSPNPLCCPARASALTGLYTHNHRVFNVFRPWGFNSFDDRSTLATWLQSSGYATIYLGKYLNGYGEMPPPGSTTGNSVAYVPPGWTSWRASIDGGLPPQHPMSGSTYAYFDTTISRNGQGFQSLQGRYQTRAYGDITEEIIGYRAPSDQPFFLQVSYTAPHSGGPQEPDDPGYVRRRDGELEFYYTPARPDDVKGRFDSTVLAAPGASWRDPDFSDKPAYLKVNPPVTDVERRAMLELTRQRAEALWVVDAQVRRTVQALRAAGELRNTLLVFTSDNGYYLGEQRRRQHKDFPHEPSIRVPMLVRGPGVPAGQVRRDPITSLDIPLTLAEAAGVRPPGPVDGVSMLAVARDGDRGWTRGILTESRPGASGQPRDTDEAGGTLDPGEPADVRYAIGVRTWRYLYVDLKNGDEELYDIPADPRQYHNLAGRASHADVLDDMRALLGRLRACDGAECRAPLPPGIDDPA